MKYIYPAIFDKEGKYYNVSFPDIPGCNTFGEGLQDSFDMAEDVLALMLYTYESDGVEIPERSDINSIEINENQFVSLVSCDTMEYRRKFDNKLINKTVTIESWLNKLAESNHINCSRLLRKALKDELGIK